LQPERLPWQIMSAKPPVIVVTGADSGIGLAIATKFAAAKYRVVLSGIVPKVGKKNVRRLNGLSTGKLERFPRNQVSPITP